jgi:hypothetical protein
VNKSGWFVDGRRFKRGISLRHAELGSASYFLRAVGIKILKQVQDDGGCRGFRLDILSVLCASA